MWCRLAVVCISFHRIPTLAPTKENIHSFTVYIIGRGSNGKHVVSRHKPVVLHIHCVCVYVYIHVQV